MHAEYRWCLVLAEEAAAMGLVNRVLPLDQVLTEAQAYARALATEVSPVAVRSAKAQLYADLHGDVGTAVARMSHRRFLQRGDLVPTK